MGEWKYSSAFLDLGTRWSEWSATRPGQFNPRERALGTRKIKNKEEWTKREEKIYNDGK
jgi:hypothetical protein